MPVAYEAQPLESVELVTQTDGGVIWSNWNFKFFSGGTSSVTTGVASNQIWAAWNNSITCATTNATTLTFPSNSIVWNAWNSQFTFTVSNLGRVKETDEQKQARLLQEQKWKAEREQADKDRKEAEAKAEALLLQNLNDIQKQQFKKHGFFKVHIGGKIYKVNRGVSRNIQLIEEKTDHDKVLRTYCAYPDGVPVGDVLLTQKLWLEANEAEFLRIANAS